MPTVTADPRFWDCPSIDTDSFLEETLGEPLTLPDSIDPNGWCSENEPAILRWLARREHCQYRHSTRDNTYNSENDLSAEFVFSIFVPEDANDCFYQSGTYVVVEKHLGGDVRGNYGPLAIYRVDSLADTGFFDWTAGWHASPVPQDVDPDFKELQHHNDQFSPGYASWPTGQIRKALVSTEPAWSDKYGCWLARLQDVPFPVKLEPYNWAGC